MSEAGAKRALAGLEGSLLIIEPAAKQNEPIRRTNDSTQFYPVASEEADGRRHTDEQRTDKIVDGETVDLHLGATSDSTGTSSSEPQDKCIIQMKTTHVILSDIASPANTGTLFANPNSHVQNSPRDEVALAPKNPVKLKAAKDEGQKSSNVRKPKQSRCVSYSPTTHPMSLKIEGKIIPITHPGLYEQLLGCERAPTADEMARWADYEEEDPQRENYNDDEEIPFIDLCEDNLDPEKLEPIPSSLTQDWDKVVLPAVGTATSKSTKFVNHEVVTPTSVLLCEAISEMVDTAWARQSSRASNAPARKTTTKTMMGKMSKNKDNKKQARKPKTPNVKPLKVVRLSNELVCNSQGENSIQNVEQLESNADNVAEAEDTSKHEFLGELSQPNPTLAEPNVVALSNNVPDIAYNIDAATTRTPAEFLPLPSTCFVPPLVAFCPSIRSGEEVPKNIVRDLKGVPKDLNCWLPLQALNLCKVMLRRPKMEREVQLSRETIGPSFEVLDDLHGHKMVKSQVKLAPKITKSNSGLSIGPSNSKSTVGNASTVRKLQLLDFMGFKTTDKPKVKLPSPVAGPSRPRPSTLQPQKPISGNEAFSKDGNSKAKVTSKEVKAAKLLTHNPQKNRQIKLDKNAPAKIKGDLDKTREKPKSRRPTHEAGPSQNYRKRVRPISPASSDDGKWRGRTGNEFQKHKKVLKNLFPNTLALNYKIPKHKKNAAAAPPPELLPLKSSGPVSETSAGVQIGIDVEEVENVIELQDGGDEKVGKNETMLCVFEPQDGATTEMKDSEPGPVLEETERQISSELEPAEEVEELEVPSQLVEQAAIPEVPAKESTMLDGPTKAYSVGNVEHASALLKRIPVAAPTFGFDLVSAPEAMEIPSQDTLIETCRVLLETEPRHTMWETGLLIFEPDPFIEALHNPSQSELIVPTWMDSSEQLEENKESKVVSAASYSPTFDGTALCAASDSNEPCWAHEVLQIEFETGGLRLMCTVATNVSRVHIAVGYLATVTGKLIQCWCFDGNLLFGLDAGSSVCDLASTPGLLAALSQDSLFVWNESGLLLATLKHNAEHIHFYPAFGPGPTGLLSLSGFEYTLWNCADAFRQIPQPINDKKEEATLRGTFLSKRCPVTICSFHDPWLALCTSSNTIHLYKGREELPQTLQLSSAIQRFTWAHQNPLFATSTLDQVLIWRCQKRGWQQTYVGCRAPTHCISWNSDDTLVLVAGQFIQVVNAKNGSALLELPWTVEIVQANPVDPYILASAGNQLHIWNISGLVMKIHEGPVTHVQWSLDGRNLFALDELGRLLIFSFETGKERTTEEGLTQLLFGAELADFDSSKVSPDAANEWQNNQRDHYDSIHQAKNPAAKSTNQTKRVLVSYVTL